ncbi:MAG: MarR family transcriptional regulator [Thermaerobacter sp.]|nr:MarR family transcriptional regulator [Thermaerobacter sp.]
MADESARLFDATFALVRVFERQFRRDPDPYHITPTQFHAMTLLSVHDTVTLLEIAHLLRVAPPTATRAIDALEQKGLLIKDRDPQDRRLVWLHLSGLGVSLVQEARRQHLDSFRTWLAPLSGDEQQRLLETLEKIVAEGDG